MSAPPIKRVERRTLGMLMTQWHSSMSDPIYAVGSFYFDGNAYPIDGYARGCEDGPAVVRAALASIEGSIPEADRGLHGWGPNDAAQLRRIAAGLRYYLLADYGAPDCRTPARYLGKAWTPWAHVACSCGDELRVRAGLRIRRTNLEAFQTLHPTHRGGHQLSLSNAPAPEVP